MELPVLQVDEANWVKSWIPLPCACMHACMYVPSSVCADAFYFLSVHDERTFAFTLLGLIMWSGPDDCWSCGGCVWRTDWIWMCFLFLSVILIEFSIKNVEMAIYKNRECRLQAKMLRNVFLIYIGIYSFYFRVYICNNDSKRIIPFDWSSSVNSLYRGSRRMIRAI